KLARIPRCSIRSSRTKKNDCCIHCCTTAHVRYIPACTRGRRVPKRPCSVPISAAVNTTAAAIVKPSPTTTKVKSSCGSSNGFYQQASTAAQRKKDASIQKSHRCVERWLQ